MAPLMSIYYLCKDAIFKKWQEEVWRPAEIKRQKDQFTNKKQQLIRTVELILIDFKVLILSFNGF